MKNNKNKEVLLAYLITLSLFLSGCAEKATCLMPLRHVHKYVKEDDNGNTIVRYIESENKSDKDYIRDNEYILIDDNARKIYKLLDEKCLFVGKDNWNYLYNLMANNQDYLEYFYEIDNTQLYS